MNSHLFHSTSRTPPELSSILKTLRSTCCPALKKERTERKAGLRKWSQSSLPTLLFHSSSFLPAHALFAWSHSSRLFTTATNMSCFRCRIGQWQINRPRFELNSHGEQLIWRSRRKQQLSSDTRPR